jgi:hypothetical protein
MDDILKELCRLCSKKYAMPHNELFIDDDFYEIPALLPVSFAFSAEELFKVVMEGHIDIESYLSETKKMASEQDSILMKDCFENCPESISSFILSNKKLSALFEGGLNNKLKDKENNERHMVLDLQKWSFELIIEIKNANQPCTPLSIYKPLKHQADQVYSDSNYLSKIKDAKPYLMNIEDRINSIKAYMNALPYDRQLRIGKIIDKIDTILRQLDPQYDIF